MVNDDRIGAGNGGATGLYERAGDLSHVLLAAVNDADDAVASAARAAAIARSIWASPFLRKLATAIFPLATQPAIGSFDERGPGDRADAMAVFFSHDARAPGIAFVGAERDDAERLRISKRAVEAAFAEIACVVVGDRNRGDFCARDFASMREARRGRSIARRR